MVCLSLTTAFVASLLVSSASASPVARDAFTVVPLQRVAPANRTVQALVAHGAARLAHFNGGAKFSKFAAGSSGEVTNVVDSYIAPVKVGSQTFNLIIDTGSSNTWVGANTRFEPDSNSKSTNQAVSVSYGSGQFRGTEYTAPLSFAGLTVAQQSVGVANTTMGFSGVDGILGVGPVGLTAGTVEGGAPVPTFMNNLAGQRAIPAEVLGVAFAPENGNDGHDANGELTLGDVDSSKYTGALTYAPLLTSGSAAPYWGIEVGAMALGSAALANATGAIVDTGTTLIYIPTPAYNAFLVAANGTTDKTTGLAQFAKAPTADFVFTISNKAFTLAPADYLIPEAQYANFGLQSGSGYYSWVTDGGASGVNMIIGQKFLENFYSVFDSANHRVGFAKRA